MDQTTRPGGRSRHGAAAEVVIVEGNEPPAGARFGWLERPGGMKLRYGLWAGAPDSSNHTLSRPGTVLVLPGRAEFIEKYFETVGNLRARGFAVAIIDERGQGRSGREVPDPLKGHVSRFQDYVDDLRAFVNEVVCPQLPPPYVLLAHSMGGAISLFYLRQETTPVTCAVLTAPMIRIKTPTYLSGVQEGFVRLARRIFGPQASTWPGPRSDPAQVRFEDNVVTSDPARFARAVTVLKADPALAVGPPTLGWVLEAVAATKKLRDPAFARSIRLPVLVAQAEKDVLVDNQALADFAHRLPFGRLITIKGAKHEILMETDERRAAFWAAFDDFVAHHGAIG